LETRTFPLAAIGTSPRFVAGSRKVILASSLGTIFEFYDFFLYGSLATTISRQFFSGVDETTGFLFALLAFAAGFVVRPFGAALFGSLGDMVGRKFTFLATMFLMGMSTLAVGVLPGSARIGLAAPVLLIGIRLLQGLALGGEYGGAAVYVAEHAPDHQRAYYTSFVQATGGLGLLLSLTVILCCRLLTKSGFEVWGWRLPFWFSSVLLIVSLWIRLSMSESRTFLQAKEQGKLSRTPLTEVFCRTENLRKLLIAFGGMVSGMTVIWYMAHFYTLFFLTQSLRVDAMTASWLLGLGVLLGSPSYPLSGWLADRYGRKRVMMSGMLAAAVLVIPLFRGLTHYANPQLEQAAHANPVVVASDPRTCAFQFDPLGQRKNFTDCDKAKALLSRMGVPYRNASLPVGSAVQIRVGAAHVGRFDADAIQNVLRAAAYPARAEVGQINIPMVLLILTSLVMLTSLTYAPLAAALVEMFPTRIRYTALSVPYHTGVGWLGGLLPAISFSLVVATGNIYSGLLYPVVISSLCFLIGMRYMRETKDRDLHAE
jgi:MFS family permease